MKRILLVASDPSSLDPSVQVLSYVLGLSDRYEIDILTSHQSGWQQERWAACLPPSIRLHALSEMPVPLESPGQGASYLVQDWGLPALQQQYDVVVGIGVLADERLLVSTALAKTSCRILVPSLSELRGYSSHSLAERNFVHYLILRSDVLVALSDEARDRVAAIWRPPDCTPPAGRRLVVADGFDESLFEVQSIPEIAAKTPKVSVMIPTYGQANMVGRAIVSALTQDYPNTEVIIVDDASPDDTAASIRVWLRDERCCYHRNEINKGRVANYRHALSDLATGEWAVMLDGDDYFIDPGFLSRALAAASVPDSSVVFVQAGHHVHYLDGRPGVDVRPHINEHQTRMAGSEYIRLFLSTYFFSHAGTFFNRQRALAVGFYTAEIPSSDVESILRLAMEGDVVLMDSVVTCWVQHGENVTTNLTPQDLYENVCFIRRLTRNAVSRAILKWPDVNTVLERYEADTLLYQFKTMIGRSVRNRWGLSHLLIAAAMTNFRVLGRLTFWYEVRNYWRRLGETAETVVFE